MNKKYKPQMIARESAIKILYQMKVQNESLNMIMKNFVEKRKYDENLLKSILHQYEINEGSILQLLKDKVDINPGHMPLLDECIIHLGICEFIYINNSKNIIINEYINLAKKYSSPKMYTFLNKILDQVLEQERHEK
ncbi:MAG: transcription antitermination factor NusB [Gammaproteobacteria bacterium]